MFKRLGPRLADARASEVRVRRLISSGNPGRPALQSHSPVSLQQSCGSHYTFGPSIIGDPFLDLLPLSSSAEEMAQISKGKKSVYTRI